jgi:hypothetical protein
MGDLFRSRFRKVQDAAHEVLGYGAAVYMPQEQFMNLAILDTRTGITISLWKTEMDLPEPELRELIKTRHAAEKQLGGQS